MTKQNKIILIGNYKKKGTSACTHHQRRGRSSLERVCVQGVCPCTRPPCQWCGGCGALPSGHSPGNEMRNARLCLNKGLQVKWSNNMWLQLFRIIYSNKLDARVVAGTFLVLYGSWWKFTYVVVSCHTFSICDGFDMKDMNFDSAWLQCQNC